MADYVEMSAVKQCKELLDSINPSSMWDGAVINEACKLLLLRSKYDRYQMREFAIRLMDLLTAFKFTHHDSRVGAQLEIHLRTMAMAVHTLQDPFSKEDFKLAKDERDQLYKSVTTFRDFLEKQGGVRNPNVTFKLSEIRNALELIRDDHSVTADFAKRFVSLVQGAQAIWAHDYQSALKAFLVAFDFELPVGNWYQTWMEIQTKHYVFSQLRLSPDFDESTTEKMLPFLRKGLVNALSSYGSTGTTKKQFIKIGNIVSSGTGNSSIDRADVLPLGILDIIQDVIQLSRRGNMGADCLEVIESILTSKSSSKMLRYKALEVMFVIRDHPGTSVDVLNRIDVISTKFDLFVQHIDSDTEKAKNAQLKKQVQEKMDHDRKLNRLNTVSTNTNNTVGAQPEKKKKASKLMKNLFKNLQRGIDDTASDAGDNVKHEKADDAADNADSNSTGTNTMQLSSSGSDPIPKVKPRIEEMNCQHPFPTKAIPIKTWQHGSIDCEQCKATTELDVWLAAKLGDMAGLTYFLDSGVDVTAATSDGTTLLENVVLWCPDPVPAMNFLLQRGAKVDTTHTFIASAYLTQEELSKHSPSEPANLEGAMLLHLAAISHKPMDVIKVLLKYSADIGAVDKCNQTALFYFARFCADPVAPIALLVTRGIPLETQCTIRGRTAIIMVARYCNGQLQHTLLRFLANAGADKQKIDNMNWNLLHYVSLYSRSWEALKYCVEQCRLDTNALTKDEMRCLDLYLQADGPNVTEFLNIILKHDYNINNCSNTGFNCVHYAARFCTDALGTLKILCDAGADPKKISNAGFTTIYYLCINTIKATSQNLAEAVRFLVDKGADVNVRNDRGYTALGAACFLADPLPVVQALVESGAVPKPSTTTDGALHWLVGNTAAKASTVPCIQYLFDAGWLISAKSGGKEVLHAVAGNNGNSDTIPKLKMLLEKGADVAACDEEGKTALHYLLENEKPQDLVEEMKLLIDNGAPINAAAADGSAPVHCAASNEVDPIAALTILKEAGADFTLIGGSYNTVLIGLVLNGECDAEVLSKFFKLGVPVDFSAADDEGWTAFHCVASESSDPLPLFKILIEAGADPKQASSPDQMTALHYLGKNSDIEEEDLGEATRYLIKQNVPFDTADDYGYTPLMRAALESSNPTSMFEVLIEAGANVNALNSCHSTAIHEIWDNVECEDQVPHAKFLFENGAKLDIMDEDKWTPMHSCAYFSANPAPGLKFLIESGADVNATTEDSETMLHILAQSENCVDLSLPAKILVDAAVSIHARSSDGYTALHALCCYDDDPKDSIKVLLDYGADATALDNIKMTPLHVLNRYCSSGALEAIPQLIEAGCPVDAKDDSGFTPLHYAALYQDDPLPIIKLLIEHGADINARDNIGKCCVHYACRNVECQNIPELLENLIALRQSDVVGDSVSQGDVMSLVDLKDNNGYTPIHSAATTQADPIPIIKVLMKHGADLHATAANGQGICHTLVCNTISENIPELLENLIALQQSDVAGGDSVSQGDVMSLINLKDNNGYTPMHSATTAQADPIPIIKVLIKHGADLHATAANGRGICHTLVCNTISENIPELLENLITLQSDVAGDDSVSQGDVVPLAVDLKDNNGYTPMHSAAAAQADPIPIIKVLMKHGADFHATAANGHGICHILARNTKSQNIPELLENLIALHQSEVAGNDSVSQGDVTSLVDLKDNSGYTPMHSAAMTQADPIPIINVLMKHGADFHATATNGHGIWHILAYSTASDMTKVFESMPEPPQLNLKDVDGTTPTHLVCCSKNDITHLQWMIDHGGDPGLVWKNTKPVDGEYNGPRDGLVDSIIRLHSNITEYLLEHRLCNPRLAIPMLEWKKAKTTGEDEIKVLDELMTKIVTAAEMWGPKSEEAAVADAETTTKVEGADEQLVIEAADVKVDVVTMST